MTPEREAQYRLKLTEAVTAGHQVLKRGGTALDAVVTAIVLLEDSGIFNAGKGAVFTSAGTCELDASMMNGASRAAGAVAGVKRIKKNIRTARAVMENSPHVLMVGSGAESFAAGRGLTLISPKYFGTEEGRREHGIFRRPPRSQPCPQKAFLREAMTGRAPSLSGCYHSLLSVA